MHMKTKEYLRYLQKEIHSTAFATIGADGHPQVRIIDIMLADENSIYFITAKGKEFYTQLVEQGFVAVSGTKDKVAISLRGKIRSADQSLLDEVFRQNPYMCDIYPEGTRSALEVFQLYEGQGEYFDLNQTPIFRDAFALGDATIQAAGYIIDNTCVGCGVCAFACPQKCIDSGKPFVIRQENCLHCGTCAKVCPGGAARKVGAA